MHEAGGREEDRGIEAGHEPDQHREGEPLERIVLSHVEEEEHDIERNTVDAVKIDRDRVWFTERFDEIGQRQARARQVLADAVEDDDRVVDREADDREEGGDDREVDLELVPAQTRDAERRRA